jgi:hypothetical protein
VVIFSLIAGATLFGIIGALLTLPVAATILMLIDELSVELPGESELEDDAATREMDERGELEYERRTEGLSAVESAAIAVEMVGERKKRLKARQRRGRGGCDRVEVEGICAAAGAGSGTTCVESIPDYVGSDDREACSLRTAWARIIATARSGEIGYWFSAMMLSRERWSFVLA